MPQGEPILQSGSVTPGHAWSVTTDGVAQDGGSSASGNLSEIGVTKNGGVAIGINSESISNIGGYNQFGFGIDSSGTATVYVETYNGAPDAELIFDINGAKYPFVTAGGGDVIGPGSAVSGDLVSFNGSTGTLVKDSGIPSSRVVQGPTVAVSGNIPTFNGTTGSSIKDSGVSFTTVVQGPTVAVSGDVATFNGVTGALIKDSGILSSRLVQGPTVAVAGDIAIFKDTTGQAVVDSGIGTGANGITVSGPGVFTNTQMNLGSQFILNSLNPQTVYQLTHSGHFATIGLTAGVAVPGGATMYEVDAFAAFVTNNSAGVTGAVAGIFHAINLAAGTTSYALNPVVSDQNHASTIVGAEWDIGAQNTSTQAIGSNMIGVFPNGTPTSAVAYQVSVLNSPWGYSFVSFDGAAANFALAGALGVTANSDSQPLQFNARDNGNVVRTAGLQALHTTNGCNLHVSTPTGSFTVSGGSSFAALAGFAQGISVTALSTSLAGFLSGMTGVGSITTNGTTTAYNTTSDYRVKVTFGTFSSGSLIDQIPVYDAEYTALPGHRRPMMLAHEIVAGGGGWAVIGEKDAVDEQGNPVFQQVDYLSLFPAAWAELQALRVRAASAETRLAALEAALTTHG